VAASAPALTIVVSAPLSTDAWVGDFMRDGAELAARQLDGRGGVRVSGTARRVTVTTLDNAGSASESLSDARQAVADHASALLTDGTGAAAVSSYAAQHDLPVFICFDGGAGLIDPERWPTTYRMAPADAPMAMRLADYLAAGHPRAALIADTTPYGSQGAAAMTANFARDKIPLVSHSTVPADATDPTAQVLAARRAGATLLSVWASPAVVAGVVSAARSAGWSVPIWGGPTTEDPLVRQQLAAHPDWLTGVGFVSFRITAEVGPKPFAAFRSAFTAGFGDQPIGVTQNGQRVLQPPDWAMFPYDTVDLVAKAASELPAGSAPVGAPLQSELAGHAVIVGANGDERGFTRTAHEGVSPGDMYFAQFHGFTFAPVTNDPLSVHLPAVSQLG
jgi:ABC-type branched-subunit amino acid transport system substrate-binding protein